MESNGEVSGGVLGPVEVEACDLLDRLANKGDGDGLAGVREVGLPLCVCGAVDRREGKLPWLILVWGGDGEALGDIAGDGGDVGDVAVLEGESSVGYKLVGCRVVVADLDWDRGAGVFLAGVHVGGA